MKKEINNLKSIMISGYFGFANCGDEAILMAMIQDLSRYIPKENVVVLSQSPLKTKELYQVNSLDRLNPFLIIAQMKKTAVFISGGGGLLQDVSGRGFSIGYYLGLIFLANLFKIPTIVYAQGVGPVKKRFNKKIIKLVLNKVNLIIVRDEKSSRLLQELGIKKELISVCADSSFLLKKEKLPEEIIKKYQLTSKSGTLIDTNNADNITIGIVLRNCKEIEQNYESKIIQLAKIVDFLAKKFQAKLIFIPFQIGADLTLIKDIIKKIDYPSVTYLKEEISSAQMLSLFSHLSLIIGMRFHALVFATISNKPFLAIDYDPKVRNYIYSIGLPELLLNINQLTVKNVNNKLEYIRDNQEKIKSILNSATEQYQKKAIMASSMLKEFMEEKYFRIREEEKNT
jgi:polysaccharide pyruvyl transferase CsaB